MPAVGDAIGPYHITRVIRRAAPAATWYLARRAANEPEVVLQLTAAPDDWLRLQIHEAGYLRWYAHRHVARIDDLAATAQVAYVAREHVDGATLAALSGQLPLDIAVAIGLAICEGLGYLHALTTPSRGDRLDIVHRMVEPDNVVLGRDGAVKLYGDRVAAPGYDHHAHDLSSWLQYLSPEAIRGLPVEPRSDLYQLGAILWELTVGAPRIAERLASDELLARIKREAEPPSAVRRDYPRNLEHVVMRAMARDPAARYPTAAALHDELAAVAETLGPPPDLAAFARQVMPVPGEAAQGAEQAGNKAGPVRFPPTCTRSTA